MFEVGNLRIKMGNGSIWATQQQMPEPDISSFTFVYPFSEETGFRSLTDSKYEINYYDGSTETGDYVGGLIGCDNVVFNLQEDWFVEFDYMFTGDINNKGTRNEGDVAVDWNMIFCFGRHIDGPSPTEVIGYYLPLTPRTAGLARSFCNPPIDTIGYHNYVIKHYNGITTVIIDGLQQETNQYDYPAEYQGFYLSGGGHHHSIPCRIKNLKISASTI